MEEDRVLIGKLRHGDRDALRGIYEKHKNDLLKLAVVLSNDVNAAEDVVQDVFVNFARSAGKGGPRGGLKKYLTACVANRIRNLWRDGQRHRMLRIEDSDIGTCGSRRPEQWAILSEELQMLRHAMAQIPEEQREVIGLYMQGDMSLREIARIQDASVSTVRGRYRYGLSKLRSLLNSEVTK